jgi:hypothetical protein
LPKLAFHIHTLFRLDFEATTRFTLQ